VIIIGHVKFVSRENIRIMDSLRKNPVDRHIVNELFNKLVYDRYKNLLPAQTDHPQKGKGRKIRGTTFSVV